MAPVLVCGESGTGKELVARAVHEVSPRAALPFVAVNCGAIPENLLEAQFFGYRKGAFTGANEDREGFFQAAQGGTLFLDEIGDLPLAMQSKLLRVIQERAVRPLGAISETPVNVRVVSATHKDLVAEVQAGRFRQDLFYRLNVIRITMPPLRERLGDLPALCNSVLQRIARDAGVSPAPTLSEAALLHLARYGFAGNVRELENLLHRALALSNSPRIEQEDLGLPEEALDDTPGADAETAAAPAPLPAAPAAVPNAAALPSDLAAHLEHWSATATTAPQRGPAWACRCARCATAWRAWQSARRWARQTATTTERQPLGSSPWPVRVWRRRDPPPRPQDPRQRC